jgi:hypothetical protein
VVPLCRMVQVVPQVIFSTCVVMFIFGLGWLF